MIFKNVFTITYGNAEKSAADWGLTAEPRLSLRDKAAKRFTWLMAAADPVDAVPFPFEAKVTIQLYDAGGNVIYKFVGRQTTENGIALPGQSGIALEFQDTWYDLENLIFQIAWNFGQPNIQPLNFCRIYLFQDINNPGAHLSVKQQITNIVNYAVAAGVNITVGNIDNDQQMPFYAVRAMSCAAGILKCLECFPGMKVWIDDSGPVPKLHCRSRANLTPLNLPFAGMFNAAGQVTNDFNAAQRIHKSTRITPLYKLQASSVVIQYQQTNRVNDASYIALATEIYPVGSTGKELRSIVVPIDLRGSNETDQFGKIVSATFNPENLEYWKGNTVTGQRGKTPHLGDTNVVGLDFAKDAQGNLIPVTVTDINGNPVDHIGTYPFEHKSGTVYSWMHLQNGNAVNLISEVRVTAMLTYTHKNKNGVVTRKAKSHKHTMTVKLTNSPPATSRYSALKSFSGGESAVAGLAQSIYNDRSVLQHDGQHEIIERGSPAVIGPWNVINLVGGRAEWTNMNADVAAVDIDFFAKVDDQTPGIAWRNTTITIGPAKHLSPQDLNNYLQFFRGRIIIDNPQSRITGLENSGVAIDTAGDTPMQDTQPALSDSSLFAITGDTPAEPTATLDVEDIKTADAQNAVPTANIQAKMYPVPATVGGQQKTISVLCSEAPDSLGAGGSGGNWNWRGLYIPNPQTPYKTFDVVALQAGSAAGVYLSIVDNNNASPDIGPGWIQVATLYGTWQ